MPGIFSKDLSKIVSLVKKGNPKADTAIVKKAFWFSLKAHHGQKRASGEPYFIHPVFAATYLAGHGVDGKTIAATLLHDVLEDTEVKGNELKAEFGSEIFGLVDGVTKFDLLSREGRRTSEVLDLQKIMLATIHDVRVLLIKLADKLHNIKTLRHLPAERQKAIAHYALEVYAPLAHKLGIHEIKHEIETLCFPIVYPSFYEKFHYRILTKRRAKEKEMDLVIKCLKKEPIAKKFSFEKQHRSYFSIYKKMGDTGKTFEQLYDFSILIILTESEMECYKALYLLHKNFYPLPMKFKDHIAEPLMATYKSLHTTVMGPKGEPVKVYIRSREMHKFAEIGIIAALNDSKKMAEFAKQKLDYWKLINAMKSREFESALKTDFLKNTIFVFNKNGKMIELPADSTPLDFAYAMNSGNGSNRCFKAKVNEKIVPLWHPLEFGDKIEIIRAKCETVNPEWLQFVQSHFAKNQILKALKGKTIEKQKIQAIELEIKAVDRIGLLADISQKISTAGANIRESSAKTGGKKLFSLKYVLDIKNSKQLHNLTTKLKELPEVKTVKLK